MKMHYMLLSSKEMMFQIGAMIHNPDMVEKHGEKLELYVREVSENIEDIIRLSDECGTLAPLEGFIVPNSDNANEMLARAVVRRAERSAVKSDNMWAVPVLNTMSDLIFLIAWHNTVTLEQWTGF